MFEEFLAASCLTRSWGRAKRLTAALLAALRWRPRLCAGGKEGREDGALEEIEKIIVYGDLQQITQSIWELLEISPEDDPVCQDGWYLHPKGFAFQIPDGMTLLENYRGTTVMLVDKADEDAVFSTSISVVMAGEDKELDKLTRKRWRLRMERSLTIFRSSTAGASRCSDRKRWSISASWQDSRLAFFLNSACSITRPQLRRYHDGRV